MADRIVTFAAVLLGLAGSLGLASPVLAAPDAANGVLTGAAAMGDWTQDAPGVVRRFTVADVPPQSQATALPARLAPRPEGAQLHTLKGFSVAPFAKLPGARQIRIAPNGDIFVAQSQNGQISVIRAQAGSAAPESVSTFAKGLALPFGMAFYPAGPNPKWLYVGEVNRVVRFPYRNGDLVASAAPQTIIPKIAPSISDHVTRDLEISRDGQRLYLAVGSGSNVGIEMAAKTVAEAQAWDKSRHGVGKVMGAAWGPEENRANILTFKPDGSDIRIVATGVRNCVTLRLEPKTGAPWCVVNERDSLGDNLPFDYATAIRTGAFYGWPWFYLGDHVDSRPKSARPDLAGKVTVPDVMFQAHSAPLGLAFYQPSHGPAAFPTAFDDDAFVALHGSWNRANRTGYKIVRMTFHDGKPTGAYEDFLTGFVIDGRRVWGRPVGVAEAHDGALLVSDDGGGMIWRIAPDAAHP